MIYLTVWHRKLHEITGAMAVRFLTATSDDVIVWAQELHAIATAMRDAAGTRAPAPVADAPVADRPMPAALRQRLMQR
jgi:hypothetical protein